jgi:hypothetical protein
MISPSKYRTSNPDFYGLAPMELGTGSYVHLSEARKNDQISIQKNIFNIV